MQVSPTNSFTVSTDEAAADESGEKVPDYAVLSNTTQKCNISASAEEMDKALVKILKWTEGNVPAEQEMYVRVNAYILEGTNHLNPIASNSVKLNVKPYYIELKDAVPTMWYLVGNMFGAKWANDKNIGEDALPMFLKPNFSYDKKTGAGEIEYTNYFLTGDYNDKAECDGAGFKILPSDFNWDYSMNAMKSEGQRAQSFIVMAVVTVVISLLLKPVTTPLQSTLLTIQPRWRSTRVM